MSPAPCCEVEGNIVTAERCAFSRLSPCLVNHLKRGRHGKTTTGNNSAAEHVYVHAWSVHVPVLLRPDLVNCPLSLCWGWLETCMCLCTYICSFQNPEDYRLVHLSDLDQGSLVDGCTPAMVVVMAVSLRNMVAIPSTSCRGRRDFYRQRDIHAWQLSTYYTYMRHHAGPRHAQIE